MASVSYSIDKIKCMALKGDTYQKLVSDQSRAANLQSQLSQVQASITKRQADLLTLQRQVLASLTPTPPVPPTGTPINMTFNQDGTATLVVGT